VSKPIVAMLCITLIVITAMLLGIDGFVYGLGIAAVSGLGGFAVSRYAEAVKNKRNGNCEGLGS